MTDRELLERTAKAADFDALFQMYGWDEIGDGAFLDGNEPPTVWNPLTDDGDALRLAVKLHLVVEVGSAATLVYKDGPGHCEDHSNDPAAATRRAIVRAAAAMYQARQP